MTNRDFDDFELGRVLGVGTVGTIYEAYDKANSVPVALKCLLATVSSDQIIQARFAREMIILEKLFHPNIVKYFSGGKHGGQLFYAMELLDGGSLKEALSRTGAFSWIEVATCGIQICSALQHAHNHGIIHRDLKPSNLLFDQDGCLKLVDFGIARDTHEADITSKGLTVGSHTYISPEQITGKNVITGHTDLYSLGVVLFELLTGRPPFEGENFAQLFQQHLTTPPPTIVDLAPRTPVELERLVLQLLAKVPEDRPFNARAVQGELLALINPQIQGDVSADVSADDVSATEAMDYGRQALKRRLEVSTRDVSWATLAGIGIALAAFVGAAWYFVGS